MIGNFVDPEDDSSADEETIIRKSIEKEENTPDSQYLPEYVIFDDWED